MYTHKEKLHQLGGEFKKVFFSVPWRHHVTAVDKLLKQDDDKPTIGLLICKSKDDTKVEWSFDGLQKPIGVASYNTNIADVKAALPTAEEIERGLSNTEK